MTAMKLMVLFLILAAKALPVSGDELKFKIPNELNHEWPGELVSFDLDGK